MDVDKGEILKSADKEEILKGIELIEQRKIANLLILKGLENYFKENEQIRFIQGLWDLQLITDKDLFYEEPMRTLERLNHYMPDFFPLDIDDEKEPPSEADFERLREERYNLKENVHKLEDIVTRKSIEINSLQSKLEEKDNIIDELRRTKDILLEEIINNLKADKETVEEFVKMLISRDIYKQ